MYHTATTNGSDQHTHPFLWRHIKTTREADTYVLIGFEYAGFHPQKEQRSKHLAPIKKSIRKIRIVNARPLNCSAVQN